MADVRAESFNFGGSDRYIIPQDYYINVGHNPDTLETIINETYDEIVEVYNMGYTLFSFIRYSGTSYIMPLVSYNSNEPFIFGLDYGVISMSFVINTDGTTTFNFSKSEYVPVCTKSDAGKILMVGDDGNAAWTAITNAEEVAY